MDLNIIKKCGNVSQLCYINKVEYTEGNASGISALQIKNQKLYAEILLSKAMDISLLSYCGDNISFVSKNSLVNPMQNKAFSSMFNGGFLYTCGLDNIGGPTAESPLHGRLALSPAVLTKKEITFKNGELIAEIEGFTEQTALFSQSLALKRNYKIYGDKIVLTDTITNNAYKDAGYMLLYHFNIGYPTLDEGVEISGNFESTNPRNKESAKYLKEFNIVTAPEDNKEENVYIHKISGESAEIRVKNHRLKRSLIFEYNTKNLPYLMQWKSMASGDYALGIEPASTHLDNKELTMIKSGESREFQITLRVI